MGRNVVKKKAGDEDIYLFNNIICSYRQATMASVCAVEKWMRTVIFSSVYFFH